MFTALFLQEPEKALVFFTIIVYNLITNSIINIYKGVNLWTMKNK